MHQFWRVIQPKGKIKDIWGNNEFTKFKESRIRRDKLFNTNYKNGIMIKTPIQTRPQGRGNPVAILQFGVDLNTRQINILKQLKSYNQKKTFHKLDVSLRDLAALTAKTGVEFAMFTRGSQRLVIRGDYGSVNVTPEYAKELKELGYKFSGHTHPGIDSNSLVASEGDYEVLKAFEGRTSVIYNSKGMFLTFEVE